MKILVTGSAGFIGHHACRHLGEKGHEILGVDNFNDYYEPKLKKFRQELLDQSGIGSYKKIELADLSALNSVVADFEPEVIVHLAAQAGVRYSIDHPQAYLRSNLAAFLNILEVSRNFSVRRLVYASSSSVYGGLTTLPFSETMSVDTPISLYAATKKSNELMAHAYTHLYGFQSVGLRFFTVYGPLGRPDMAMWLFTDAILRGRPIQVFNHGKMRRDFTYIDDIIQGICGAVERDLVDKYSIYNLGNHRCEELEKLIGLLEKYLGKSAMRENRPMQPGDVPATFADVEKARRDLGFNPRTSIESGVESFIRWYTGTWLKYMEDNS